MSKTAERPARPHMSSQDVRVSLRRIAAGAALVIALGAPLGATTAFADGVDTGAATGRVSFAVSSLESTATTPSPEATPTAVFAGNASWGVKLHLPARPESLIAVGFHQASGRRVLKLTPVSTCLRIYNPKRTRRMLSEMTGIKMFQQALRGRGTSNFSAADCAVLPKAQILAPVTGTVTCVKTYKLYGRYRDVRLEIQPDNCSRKIRVVVLHIQDPVVKKGWHVTGGVSPIATVRHFRFESAVNRYLTVKKADHAHIQINRK